MVLQVVNPMGETTWSMLATPDKVGRIIGRSGVTIKELETRSGTRIQIDHKALGEQKPVHVSGPPSNVDLCKQLIKELLENDTPGGGLNAIAGAGEATRSMECPAGIVGRIIGRGGETIRSLQSASGAHILVDQVGLEAARAS
ncbi:WW domain-containing protein, partial [Haematococcus lacustris]